MNYDTGTKVVYTLEPVCCKKQLLVCRIGTSEDSELYEIDSG